jgi:TonB family protein
VQPAFPLQAAKAGVTEGSVSARFHVETDGKVSKVDILKATGRYFEKEVINAANNWKYAPLSHPQVAVVEFHFKMDSN